MELITILSCKYTYVVEHGGVCPFIKRIGCLSSLLHTLNACAILHIASLHITYTISWPYVTLSSFQHRASTARKQSGALLIHINPEVDVGLREDWETFTVEDSDASWM